MSDVRQLAYSRGSQLAAEEFNKKAMNPLLSAGLQSAIPGVVGGSLAGAIASGKGQRTRGAVMGGLGGGLATGGLGALGAHKIEQSLLNKYNSAK